MRSLAVAGAAASVLVGCGGGSDRTSEDPESGAASAALDAAGPVYGDPSAIEPFTDPETQLETPEDLTTYLLPGFTGPGVDCVVDRVELPQILQVGEDVGAEAAASLVVDCVEDESFGKIAAMYAVGFESDGDQRYQTLEGCAMTGFGDKPDAARVDILQTIYEKRLDLYGPPDSRIAAADELELGTTCLDAPGPDLPDPEATTEAPVNAIPVPWTLVQVGACVASLPAGSVDRLLTVNCETPHRFEVVGASFGSVDSPQATCRDALRNYAGAPRGAQLTIETLTPAPGSVNAKVVCLAGRADDQKVTGTLQK